MLLHIQLPLWDVPAIVNDYGEVKDEVILRSSARQNMAILTSSKLGVGWN